MYRDVISKDYDTDNIHDKYLKILNKKQKALLLKIKHYDIADNIALWLKYFERERTFFENLVNAYSYELFSELTKIKMNQIYNGVERLLREKYKIYIVYRKPLILKSDSLLESV